MKYKSFQDYLLVNNLTDKLSETERIELQAQWRKAYQKAYHQNYGKKRIRKTISLDSSENTKLVNAAQKHQMKLNYFIKSALLGYLNQVYVVPNEEQVLQVIIQLRKIGTNINQIARHVNSHQGTEQGQLGAIYSLLEEIEKSIKVNLLTPKILESSLERVFIERPKYIDTVSEIVEKYKVKNKEV